ncbi:Na+/H+ antiporter subunit E [Cellulomonas sp. ATA003]|uniref:Na+/H+ antiporter subunit E n=1 Tax=Cellulomonas sp. ATA003 TaxID=3073064 RepID=UPI002873CB6D|nr:Na+/H+ antiporter subunit E [Cellulomonas sp. ATA003]WNB85745.1 Na+/H+ antiporter subunit E [Cellulomonas sp. ATA003]
MSLHTRRRRIAVQWPTLAWLTVVWVLLWGDLTVANVLAGLAIALVVSIALPLPPVAAEGRLRPLGILRLFAVFAKDVVVASVVVSIQAFRRRPPRSAVIRVRLRSSSDLYLTLTAEFCSLVPGSLVVEAHRLTSTLYMHVLDAGGADGIEDARRRVLDQEERVMRAFASDREIEAAGLDRSRQPVESSHEVPA